MQILYKKCVRNAYIIYNGCAFTYQGNLCMGGSGDQGDEYVFSATMGPINKAMYCPLQHFLLLKAIH